MPPDGTVLAFDTAAAHCAAALVSGGRTITRVDPMAKGQAEHLMGMLHDMLHDAGLAWRDLTVIGVGTGPGNFTGTRIAVSAARGLALGLGVPAIGVSVFDTTARLSRATRIAVPAPHDQHYIMDFDANTPPAMIAATDLADAVRCTDYSAAAHVACIAAIAAARAGAGAQNPRPAPLYVRPADAAPARDAAPVILP